MVDLGERNRAEFKKTKHLISDVTPGCSIYRDCFGSPETAAHVQELVIPVTKGSGHTQHGLHYCTQPRGSLYPPRGSKCRLQNALLPSRRNCFQNMIKYREMRQKSLCYWKLTCTYASMAGNAGWWMGRPETLWTHFWNQGQISWALS